MCSFVDSMLQKSRVSCLEKCAVMIGATNTCSDVYTLAARAYNRPGYTEIAPSFCIHVYCRLIEDVLSLETSNNQITLHKHHAKRIESDYDLLFFFFFPSILGFGDEVLESF